MCVIRLKTQMNFTSGEQCVQFIQKFTAHPPRKVYFRVPAIRNCGFDVPKVMVRVASLTDPLNWDVVFVYRNGVWHIVGGRKITASMTRKLFSPSQVARMLCQALVARKGQARLEVDLSFRSDNPQCDYVEWDYDTDRAVIDGTRMGVRYSVLDLAGSTFPHQLFECTGTELKFIYDFSKQKRISIWDPRELAFQESATLKPRHRR